jgi:DNA (cytosine-5)-methyltransferase 1
MERIKPHKAMSRKNNDNHEPEKQKRLTPVRATISEKWLKPRKIVKRIDRASNKHWSVVSFFAGCGGLDLGFLGGFSYNGIWHKRLPFEVLMAYDNDRKAIDTYRLNIDDHASVEDLAIAKPADIPRADILIGGFPCQDFATCGPRQGLDSERGRLYLALVKYAKTHRPRVIVAENVPGLENIADGEVLKQIVSDIKQSGYNVAVWKLFGPDYGVPQRRTRLFIVGIRKDQQGFPIEPVPTHRGKHRSLRWAISDLETVSSEEVVANQSQYFRATRAKKGNGQGDEKSRPDEPGYTVRANAKSRVQFHYKLNRRLTVRECARLQTFPDEFVFPHSATTNMMQIGNAVPPMLSHTVAQSIARYMSGQEV